MSGKNDDLSQDVPSCTKCGNKITGDANFCAICGQAVSKPPVIESKIVDDIIAHDKRKTISSFQLFLVSFVVILTGLHLFTDWPVIATTSVTAYAASVIGLWRTGSLITTFLGSLFVSLLVFVVFQFATGEKRSGGVASDSLSVPKDYSSEAKLECRDLVIARLISPSSADFQSVFTTPVSKSGDTYSVSSYVDSQNGFGAMIRTHYSCIVEKSGNSWKTIEVTLN